jgi:UDP-glucose 4-epimerase
MKVMIFGGAGFIGSHLTDLLVEDGHNVVLVDNLITGNKPTRTSKGSFFHLDIVSNAGWSELPKDIDLIIHLAFPVSLCNREYKNQFVSCSTNGMINVLEFCKKTCKKIIFGSSISVYGEPTNLPITEKTPLSPILYYGAHKLLNEHYLTIFSKEFDIKFQILRISDVFGERDKRQNAINNFISAIQKNQVLTLTGTGEQKRSYTYVKDVARGIYSLTQSELTNDIFNLVGSTNISIINLVYTISECMKVNPTLNFNTKTNDNRNYIFDNGKLINKIGDFEKIGFIKGLENTIQSFY